MTSERDRVIRCRPRISLRALEIVLTLSLLPVAIYLGFFAVALLDEAIFETFFIEKVLPERAYDFLNTMYHPMDPILEARGL